MEAKKVAALAEARKAADAKRRIMLEVIDKEKAIASKVNFEINTTEKIHIRNNERKVDKLRQENNDRVFNRRKALADIMNQEMSEWKSECLGQVETLQSRKAKLMAKAHALRDRREKERRQFVSDMYEERWREECDDVRDLDGKALSVFMAAERQKQIEDKKIRDKENAANEDAYYAAWEKQLESMAALDDNKKEKAKENNMKTFEGLKEQIAAREDAKQKHYDTMMEEAQLEIAECNAAIAAEEEKERQRKQNEINRGKEVLQFNAKYKDIAAEKKRIEAEQDKQLLDHAMELERAQIAEEKRKAKAGADAAKQYRKYLQEMMIKEAEDNNEVDEINRLEAEKIWKARDDALQARQDARDYLMKLVNEGRAEQIAYKQKMAEEERVEGRKFAQKFMSDIAEGVAKDRAEAAARRQKNVDNLQKLQEQIDERKHNELLSQQEKFLDNKRMQHIENLHQQKLGRQGGHVKVFYPKKKADLMY